jgi:hypothetical protein
MVKFIASQKQQEKADKENKRRWEIENRRAEAAQQENFRNARQQRFTNAINIANAMDTRNEALESKQKKKTATRALAAGLSSAIFGDNFSAANNLSLLRGIMAARYTPPPQQQQAPASIV